MTDAVIQKRLSKLEAEIKLIKRAVSKRPDFSVDEKNWKKMKAPMKRVRAKVYKARYG